MCPFTYSLGLSSSQRKEGQKSESVIKPEKVGEAERGGTKKVFFQPIRTDTLELRLKLGGGASSMFRKHVFG